ncbi:hypothetical protein MRX96_045364 [Rhipicephalus microplus]
MFAVLIFDPPAAKRRSHRVAAATSHPANRKRKHETRGSVRRCGPTCGGRYRLGSQMDASRANWQRARRRPCVGHRAEPGRADCLLSEARSHVKELRHDAVDDADRWPAKNVPRVTGT